MTPSEQQAILSPAISEDPQEQGFERLITNPDTDTPAATIHAYLSPHTILSTTPSLSQRQQDATDALQHQPFRDIGTGTCGRIFQQPDSPLVIKLELPHSYGERNLRNDYEMHQRIFAAFREWQHSLDIDVHVPQPFQFISRSDEEWWDANGAKFPSAYQQPTNLLFMERVRPLPLKLREALIATYCPEKIQNAAASSPGNNDCLIRPYLGKLKHSRPGRQQPSMFFNLRNFNFHVNQAASLDIDVTPIANAMADVLAIMHWSVRVDAHDVEFVLGCAPVFEGIPHTMTTTAPGYNSADREVHVWLLDFNQVRPISMDGAGVDRAVHSFVENDRYYPRVGKGFDGLWEGFKERYLRMSKLVAGDEDRGLAGMFVERLERRLGEVNGREEVAREREGG